MVKDFYIKNMVCDRCIKVLKDELKANNIELHQIELGRLRLDIDDLDLDKLEAVLKENGFSLIDSMEEKLTEKVKVELIKTMQELPIQLDKNYHNTWLIPWDTSIQKSARYSRLRKVLPLKNISSN